MVIALVGRRGDAADKPKPNFQAQNIEMLRQRIEASCLLYGL
jgi:hypothetical protein